MTDLDDEVPPLEDMSELLEQVHILHKSQEKPSQVKPRDPIQRDINQTAKTDDTTSPKATKVAQDDSKVKDTRQKNASATKQSTSFGGMKKGFLFGSSSKSKTTMKTTSSNTKAASSERDKSASSADIPLIKPRANPQERTHEISEVQAALKANTPLLHSKEWITDDLLKKLDKHPRLLQQLSDPRITQAVAKFQQNPQLAMQEYEGNPEIQQFFKDFCGLLGDHFESLGRNASQFTFPANPTSGIRVNADSPGADMSIHSSTNPKQATAADEAKMREIMSDPKVQEAVKDPEVQRLIAALRSNPDEAQRMLQQIGPAGKERVQRLVDAGLLGFASR